MKRIKTQHLLSRYLGQLTAITQSRIVGVSIAKLKEEKILSNRD